MFAPVRDRSLEPGYLGLSDHAPERERTRANGETTHAAVLIDATTCQEEIKLALKRVGIEPGVRLAS
jgi:hypothetical protein